MLAGHVAITGHGHRKGRGMHAHDRQRALDGLRGIAIALVVAYHAAPAAVPGGFVGVSVFCTLSGYLIGTRLIDEWTETGRVDLVRFWSKRARRLLPAALVVVVATVLVAGARGEFDQRLARDGLAAATYQQNWYQLSRSGGYGALFDRASPFDHFWSLAIEEQFYIGFPIVLIVLLVAFRGRRPAIAATLLAAAAASFLVPAMMGASFDRRYLGTDTRVGEIVLGVVVALARAALVERSPWLYRLALPATVALLAIAFVAPYGSSFYSLGFLPITLLTVVAMVGALRDGTVFGRVLSVRPLAALGVVSYSLYLVHWPLLTFVDGRASSRLTAVAGAMAISVALHHAVERPGMRLIPLGGRTLVAGVLATVLVAASVVVVAPVGGRDVLAEIQAAADQFGPDGPLVANAQPVAEVSVDRHPSTTSGHAAAATTSTPSVEPSVSPSTPRPPSSSSAPPRAVAELGPTLGFVGDSVALTLGLAAAHADDPDLYRPGPWAVELGCGLARFRLSSAATCQDPVERIAALPPNSVDVAVVVSCQWELIDRKLPDEDQKRDITDPVFQAHVLSEYTRVADALVARGVDTIIWGLCAPMSLEVIPDDLSARYRASRAPERRDALVAIVRRLADTHPAVEALDLAQLVAGRVDDPILRPDGNHFEWKTDVGIGADFNELIRCVLPAGCTPPA